MLNRLFAALSGSGAGNVHMVPAATIRGWAEAGQAVIVDVRETNEFASGHIPGAVNLPLSSFDASKLPAVPEGAKLVFHCHSGARCGMAAAKAVQAGYEGEINRMEGGVMGWRMAGGTLV